MVFQFSGADREGRAGIRHLTPYSGNGHDLTEHIIIEALRAAGALSVSLVAEVDGRIVGHVAFSPVTMSDSSEGCCLVGHPEYYRQFGFVNTDALTYEGVPAEY